MESVTDARAVQRYGASVMLLSDPADTGGGSVVMKVRPQTCANARG